MIVRPLLLISLLGAFLISGLAHATSHVLTVRQLPNSAYEAVINYDSSDFCDPTVNSASSIQIVGFEVLIESPPLNAITCITPVPPTIFYEKTANIGVLAAGNYTVSWVQPESFSLTTPFIASGSASQAPSAIPSSSPWSILLLVLCVLAVAHMTTRASMTRKQ